MNLPVDIMLELQQTFNIQVFVEGGTYLGNTTYWASQHFQEVYTIEFSPILYKQTSKKYQHVKNIKFIYGNTVEQVSSIIPLLKGPTLFWLDAHWSGGLTYGNKDECPILKEIDSINQMLSEHAFICIDDARLFLSPPPHPHESEQWPDIVTVLDALKQKENRYIVIFQDVIIAVPYSAKSTIVSYCQQFNTMLWKKKELHSSDFSLRKCVKKAMKKMLLRQK